MTDYGGGNVFQMSKTNHPNDYLALIEEHFSNPKRLAERSRGCRQFAVECLDWRLIRASGRDIYKELLAPKLTSQGAS